eukprot:9078875-Lingulodinium_polyedra.AAC.1
MRGGLTNAFTSESFFYELRGRIGWECHEAGHSNDVQLDEFFRSFDDYHKALALSSHRSPSEQL